MARLIGIARLISALLVVGASATAYADDTPAASEKIDGPAAVQQTKPAATPTAAAPQAEEAKPKPLATPPDTGWFAEFIDLVVRKWPDYLFGGVFGVALGFLAKWLLEQMSARIAARREFAKEVTKQISSLAEKHYWALANGAGVLAGQLEGYLASRTAHLIIPWEDRTALRDRLGVLAEETTKESFIRLCQMIWLFDSFQFQGSTTYLLTSHSAGDMCKRLYNMFVGSLSLPQDELAKIRELSIELVEGTGEKAVKATRKLRDLPPGTLTQDLIDKSLPHAKTAYAQWLRSNAIEVATAASALRAFNELLNQELAVLYRVWFRERAPFPEAYVYEQQFGQWPDLLTRESADTLALAGYQSNLLRPLGSAGAAQPSASPSLSSPEEKDRKGGSGTQGGRVQVAERRDAEARKKKVRRKDARQKNDLASLA